MTEVEVNGERALPTLPVCPSPSKKRSFDELNNEHQRTHMAAHNQVSCGSDIGNGNNTTTPNSLPEGTRMPVTDLMPPATTAPVSIPTSTTNGLVLPDSTTSSVLTPVPQLNNISRPPPTTPNKTSSMPNKKRKLSPASKEARAREQEAKERQRAEEKVKKEEEKKKRDEEREDERKKREEKKKIKEEERLAREEEKRKKDEEKTKKERSQMRLNAFFTKPTANSSPKKGTSIIPGVTTSISAAKDDVTEPADDTTTEKKVLPDYDQEFPAFFVQSHMSVAPTHRFERDSDSMKHLHEKLDATLQNRDAERGTIPGTGSRLADLFNIIPYKRRQGRRKAPTVKEILVSIQDSSSKPIDLTEDYVRESRPESLLRKIPMKILKFNEDVRPPYQGTFTRRLPETDAMRLCRNPFSRSIPGFDYDYDSEAEWEEPEEGEDLTSENEEDASEDGDEDMDGFLDDGDEDLPNGKRRIIVGDLEPVCSGIRWEGEGDRDEALFNSHRMEVISETIKSPIDPFSTSYWAKPPAPVPTNRTQPQLNHVPVHPSPLATSSTLRQYVGISQPVATPGSSGVPQQSLNTSRLQPSQDIVSQQQKPRRPFPPEQVEQFKEVVSGSDLTKAGLIEVLKKRFPKVSKEVIKDTLNSTAVRLGQKEADKKWVLI